MPLRTREALEWDIANTVIEDSEPEREAEELRIKEEGRQRKKIATKAQEEVAGGFMLTSLARETDPGVIVISG